MLLPARLELAKSLIQENGAKAAIDILNSAPDSQKHLIAVSEQRNWALISRGQLAEARKSIGEGLKEARTIDLLLQDSVVKIADKRYADARTGLNEALVKAPADIRALRLLVDTYATQKQLSTGVAMVKEHANKYPNVATIQYFLGNLLAQTGDQAQALLAFKRAKALDPKNTATDLALAQLDLKDAKWETARQSLGKVLNSKGENSQARLWLGMLESVNGNQQAAIDHFQKVIDREPNNILALNNLAYLLAGNQKRTDEALKYAQKAKELAPDNPDIEDTLGWVLYQKGIYSSAVRHLESAASKKATAQGQYHLAMAYLKTGQESRGRSLLEKLLRMDPNLTQAKTALEESRGH
jgi:tetratricopeptide (TPR) repeat protein